MRQRIWQRLFAAVAGVVVAAGSASAQAPIPAPGVGNPGVVTLPPGPVVQPSPAAAASIPLPPAQGTVVYQPTTGCTTSSQGGTGAGLLARLGTSDGPLARVCTATRGFVMEGSGGYYCGPVCDYGRSCNNGNGSFQSDLGFFLGSSRSFFSPCGPLPLDCARGKCSTPVYGRGASTPYNPCVYDSYMNH
jgi:hypothetical protein